MNTLFQTRNKKSAVVSVTSNKAAREPSGENIPADEEVSPGASSSEETEAVAANLRALAEDAKPITTAITIWNALGETEKKPRGQIRRIVHHLGTDKALAILEETQAIEVAGGMMRTDGSQRRTPGGVFFFLVRAKHPDLFPPKTWAEVKARQKAKKAEHVGAPSPQQSITQPPLVSQKGTNVKITLVGRPTSRIDDRGTYVVFVMQSQKIPALPKGLPAPDEAKTNYLVQIASKQWKKVAEAITDPEDILIVEGFPQINTKNGSISVFATNVTTKNLQRAAKEAQREQAENKEATETP